MNRLSRCRGAACCARVGKTNTEGCQLPVQRPRVGGQDFIVEAIAIGNHVEAADAELLAEHGITGVLCLARDRMRAAPPAGVEKDSWPLVDGANPRSDLEGALKKLERLLGRHPRVLVHCNARTSRSCAIVALWLARHERLPLDLALARVAARRSATAVAPDLLDALEAVLDG